MDRATILVHVDLILEKAREIFPSYRYAPKPLVDFYTKGRAAGMAYGSYRMSFNTHIMAQFDDVEAIDTVSHEIAHIVASYTGLGKGHNPGWKRIHRMLGGNGKRCFQVGDIDIAMKRQRKQYEHRGTCGTTIWVSSVIHNKMMRTGMSRVITRTKGKINGTTFTGNVK